MGQWWQPRRRYPRRQGSRAAAGGSDASGNGSGAIRSGAGGRGAAVDGEVGGGYQLGTSRGWQWCSKGVKWRTSRTAVRAARKWKAIAVKMCRSEKGEA